AYTRHDFVLQLASGDLPETAFRRYLVQDYLFLIHFARAWGLAIYKSDALGEMRRAHRLVAATLDVEIGLHIDYCRGWGLSEAAMVGEPEALETVAYTRFVLDRGFEVVGVTLQLYDHGAAAGRKGACCAGSDIYDASRVAERLGIPHYVLDYESRFRVAVIDDFVDSYARGETPVPCIRCNQRVKFRDLLSVARDLGAAALATGHYVRRVVGADGPELHRAYDAARDQSYFLFATKREELEFLRFPLGGSTKDEARDEARRFE